MHSGEYDLMGVAAIGVQNMWASSPPAIINYKHFYFFKHLRDAIAE